MNEWMNDLNKTNIHKKNDAFGKKYSGIELYT